MRVIPRRGPRWSPLVLGAAVVAVLAPIAGCAGKISEPLETSTPPAEVRPVRDLDFDFEGRAAGLGAIIPAAENHGTAQIRTQVATASGGRIRREEGTGGGWAVRFPAFAGSGDTPAASLLVYAEAEEDFLSPRRRNFVLGADFRLDAESEGSEADNGDNLMQRGLFEDDAQYKLQIDGGVPSCRIAGRRGAVLVTAARPVAREEWHRVECLRTGDAVSLVVTRLSPTGPVSPETWEEGGEIGAVRFEDRSVPLSVGAKTSLDGRVVASDTDQFNGVVDNVHFSIVD